VYDPKTEAAIVTNGNGSVTIRNTEGEIQALNHGSPICGLASFPDGRVVTAGADGLLKCWTPSLSAQLAASAGASPNLASGTRVAFADQGHKLLYQTWDRNLHFLLHMSDLSCRMFARPEVGSYGYRFPLFQPGTSDLVVDSASGLNFYSLFQSGSDATKTGSIPFARPSSAAFDASGRILVVSNYDQEVAVFDVRSRGRLPVPEAQGLGLVAVNPAGTKAALLTSTSLQVWDVASGRLLNRIVGSNGEFDSAEGAWDRSVRVPVFHPDKDLVAFIRPSENSGSTLLVWDTALGKVRASIQTEAGRRLNCFAFSPDGNRIFTNDAAIWDWQIGKELYALSRGAGTFSVAASRDGVTIAISGYSPNLRIVKALPWNKLTRRDGDFYRSVDELWTYTAQLPEWIKN
jgi:WD40 repeat protein